MIRRHNLISTVAALAVMAGGATADPVDADTRQSLLDFNATFNSYAANHDIEGLVSLYHEDAYWIAPDALPAKGRDGVPRQTITFMSENKGELSHTVDDLFVSPDGLQAVMMGVTDAAVASAGFELTGTYVYVLTRADTDAPWQVVLDMYNRHPSE
ncbi:nuclear transport factor 2 family protein [uncultured Tateyamaria sp.]|uniref:YybH family protein n=1 Tax=uncultured Tateyamaria sp. TaxID=455651 RepID=UPI002632FC61|nr:nuclear transport factor 2 family protein [uncultured Tateyamaria sp.]